GWQLSNPPIFQMASLRASMELFDQAKIERLRAKSEKLTGYLEFLLDRLPEGFCKIITPRDPAQRGAQLSLKISGDPKALLKKLTAAGVICDFREPDVIRAAPAPLYNTFLDVYRFVKILETHAKKR
ncbi:MAG: kynureninase/PvdN C-terminal domain-containing protein, partial [Bdellovibrionota bacterium]